MKLKSTITFVITLSLVVVVCMSSFSKIKGESITPKTTEEGISFIEQDWSMALQQAKKENKLVFLDIYASWCGPCKMLKKNTFSNAQVGNFFNTNFVNVSVDGEEGVGPMLAQQFAIEGYPTLIVTDNSGKPLLYTVGYMNSDELLDFAKEALKKKK